MQVARRFRAMGSSEGRARQHPVRAPSCQSLRGSLIESSSALLCLHRASFARHPKRFRRIINHPAFVAEFGEGSALPPAPKKPPKKRRKKGDSSDDSEAERPKPAAKKEVDLSRRRNVFGRQDVRRRGMLSWDIPRTDASLSLFSRCATGAQGCAEGLREGRPKHRPPPPALDRRHQGVRTAQCPLSALLLVIESPYAAGRRSYSDADVVHPHFMDELLRVATIARPLIH
jgi:hypothetical protein